MTGMQRPVLLDSCRMAREDILRRHRDVDITHPNREKPESNTARLGTVALLALSAFLMFLICIGGWSVMTGGRTLLVFIMLLYILFAYLVYIWNRGVLPVSAGAAMMVLIFALVSGPSWFDRTHVGFGDSTLPPALLGTITLGLIPIQMLLIVVSVWAFTQEWNVEEEVPRNGGATDAPPPPDAATAAPAAQ